MLSNWTIVTDFDNRTDCASPLTLPVIHNHTRWKTSETGPYPDSKVWYKQSRRGMTLGYTNVTHSTDKSPTRPTQSLIYTKTWERRLRLKYWEKSPKIWGDWTSDKFNRKLKQTKIQFYQFHGWYMKIVLEDCSFSVSRSSHSTVLQFRTYKGGG